METTVLFGAAQPISRIGLGCYPLGGHGWGAVDEAESVAAVRRAWELGVNFFDTADVYGLGRSEELLSKALGEHLRNVVIATKFGVRWDESRRTWKDASPKYLRSAIEGSLRRLRLTCIPLYYIHWPDGVTPVAETMEELLRCRQEGKLQCIGLSNFNAAQVREAMSVGTVSAVQAAMSLLDRNAAAELLPLSREANLTLVTWGSLGQGLLTGKFSIDSRFAGDDHRHRDKDFLGERFQENIKRVETLKRVAERTGRTPAQVAIRWLLDTPGVGVALSGAKRAPQIEENLGALGWRLEEKQYRMLAELCDDSKTERFSIIMAKESHD